MSKLSFSEDGCKICGTTKGPHIEIKFKNSGADICVACAYDCGETLSREMTGFVTNAERKFRQFKNAYEGLRDSS